jgi:N-hydroxyarylamine O-acetyltransferase
MSTTRPPVDESLRDAYLRRLGFTSPPPATVETLHAVHRAQLERIPYESVWIWLGERRTINPLDSVRHLVSGRGGYCYHHNGAMATLLSWLGFTVRWHVAGVQGGEPEPHVNGDHLALTVTNLPSEDNPDGSWFIDAGLAVGPHGPLPLRAGTYVQGPHTFRLRPSEIAPAGWRWDGDPSMPLQGMDFLPREATLADLRAKHEELQSSPESSFVKVLVVFRRDATGVDFMRGRVLKRFDGKEEADTELATAADWYACLADLFALDLSDVDDERKEALWRKVTVAHEEYLATAAKRAG